MKKWIFILLIIPIGGLAQEHKSDISLIGFFGNKIYSAMPVNGSYEGLEITYTKNYTEKLSLEVGVFNTDYNHLMKGRDTSSVNSFGIEYGAYSGVKYRVVKVGRVGLSICPELGYIYNSTRVYSKFYPTERLITRIDYREFELLLGSAHEVNINKVYVGFGFTQRWR